MIHFLLIVSFTSHLWRYAAIILWITIEYLTCTCRFPDWYLNKILDDKAIICIISPHHDQDTQWIIAISDSMIWPLLHWFHTMLGYLGSQYLCTTIKNRFHFPNLWDHIDKFACDQCQHFKASSLGHDILPD